MDRLFGGQAGTFVDVGANHPFLDSNTYFFYLRGWRGVNVEPSARGVELFQKYRPHDLNLIVAVSDVEGEQPFYEIDGEEGLTGLSTLATDVAEEHSAQGFHVVESRVRVRTLASLIAEHSLAPPDFLSIDVESHESHVIRGIPWNSWRPKVLVVESTLPLTHASSHNEWEPILIDHGYLFAAFNGINRFYLRDDLRDRLELLQTPVNVLDVYQRHETIAYRHRYERARDQLASERFQVEQERGAWAWGQTQARHAQAMWELERAAFENQRGTWKDALEFFERSQAEWERERQQFAQDRVAWEQARMFFERERIDWAGQRAEWASQRNDFEKQRMEFAVAKVEWERERARYLDVLTATRGQLRPYRRIDRLGVLKASYGLVRRIKQKLMS
ncbi:MAG TPA: FkbM family methyltransferase [Isosphaeraceae bacterium]|nr:FkbM family methyltransferase [Isosphaeraceae bacterium]